MTPTELSKLIPDEVVEAGARAIAFDLGYTWGAKGVDLDAFRDAARAAFLAMVGAWPGMTMLGPHSSGHGRSEPALILPLPQKETGND